MPLQRLSVLLICFACGRTERHLPARIDALAVRALLQLLQCRGAKVAQMIRAGRRDDAVPYDGLVGLIGLCWLGPLRRHVYKHLLRVPCKERRQVCLQGELEDGIFFFSRGVVVWAPFHSGPALELAALYEAERDRRESREH